MPRMNVTRHVQAPLEAVFQAVAEPRNFSQAVPAIVRIEILSEVQSGVGTRFRETRLMKGKQMSTELEVTEYVRNERVRLVTESHGTVWDTVFNVAPAGDVTELSMTMDARATKLLPRLLNPFVMGMIRKLVESDMDAVKAWCEGGGEAAGT